MKVILKHEGNKVRIVEKDYITVTQAFEMFEKALLGCGFHQGSIDDYYKERIREEE